MNDHLKTSEINSTVSSGHRSAGMLFAEASALGSAASSRLVRNQLDVSVVCVVGLPFTVLGFASCLTFSSFLRMCHLVLGENVPNSYNYVSL